MNLLAQPPPGADAEAVTDDQHPDQQLGIDRGPAFLAVIRCQLLPQPGEFDELVYRAQEMPGRDMIFQRKFVKQRLLPDAAFPPHQIHSGPQRPQ